MWIEREITAELEQAAAVFPIVALVGPRQVGEIQFALSADRKSNQFRSAQYQAFFVEPPSSKMPVYGWTLISGI